MKAKKDFSVSTQKHDERSEDVLSVGSRESGNLRIQRLASAYTAIALSGLAYLAFSAAKAVPPLLQWMDAGFVNYGDDTVSGWATIFSLIGFLSGKFFAPLVLACVVLFVTAAASYWITGIVFCLSLKKKILAGLPYKGLGTFLGAWAVIPAVTLISSLLKNGSRAGTGPVSVSSVISWVIPVVSAAVGAAILFTVYHKNKE